MTQSYSKISATKLAIAAGITWAVVVFITTLTTLYEYSSAAHTLESTIWGSFGYSVSWSGAIVGALLGFIYAVVLTWIPITIYNKILSK